MTIILTPDCLTEVESAVGDPGLPAFIYSDFVQFWPDHNSHVFAANQGWENYPFAHGGRSYDAMRAFEPDAPACGRSTRPRTTSGPGPRRPTGSSAATTPSCRSATTTT